MSNPIPHPALQHLQLTFTVAEYEALLHKYTHVSFGPSKDARDYWERVLLPLDEAIITIVGPNGSGKTTLLDAMRTLLALKPNRVAAKRLRCK